MIKNDNVLRKSTPNILIVDDIPANLKALGDILKGDGYKVRPVPNGTLALQAVEKEKPILKNELMKIPTVKPPTKV